MTITLPDLPYGKDALEPHISPKTLAFHHGKHHYAYVANLNKMIEGIPQFVMPSGLSPPSPVSPIKAARRWAARSSTRPARPVSRARRP